MKTITVKFYKQSANQEPVKQWLLKLKSDDKRIIGKDLQTIEYGWPMGMPLVRKMNSNLWEVRSNISDGRIARIFFTIKESDLVLLHGFIKKSQTTPKNELSIAQKRRDEALK